VAQLGVRDDELHIAPEPRVDPVEDLAAIEHLPDGRRTAIQPLADGRIAGEVNGMTVAGYREDLVQVQELGGDLNAR
jgi:hypothetical protein